MSVDYRTEGREAIVTIDRPEERNAVDRPTSIALKERFDAFEADDTLWVAILTGSNGVFCSGADLKGVSEGRGNRVTETGNGPLGVTRMLLSKPVIAAVEGYAVAGGLELAAWCDMRVAARDAVFGVFCRRWGVPLVDGGTIRLSRLLGHSHALDLILTGRGVSGDEALRIAGCNGPAIAAVDDQVGGAGAIVSDNPQAAGQRLAGDVAEGLGEAGKQEQVGRSIVCRQIAAGAHAGKHGVGAGRLQAAAQRPVADEQQPGVGSQRADRGKGVDDHLQVLFRRQAPDVDHHQAVVLGTPCGA